MSAGVDVSAAGLFDLEVPEEWTSRVQDLQQAGLVEFDGTVLKLTSRGRLLLIPPAMFTSPGKRLLRTWQHPELLERPVAISFPSMRLSLGSRIAVLSIILPTLVERAATLVME